jgi:hypothetical protein
MSETTMSHVWPTAKQMWREGKVRTFYRGLVVCPLQRFLCIKHTDMVIRSDLLVYFHIQVSLGMLLGCDRGSYIPTSHRHVHIRSSQASIPALDRAR